MKAAHHTATPNPTPSGSKSAAWVPGNRLPVRTMHVEAPDIPTDRQQAILLPRCAPQRIIARTANHQPDAVSSYPVVGTGRGGGDRCSGGHASVCRHISASVHHACRAAKAAGPCVLCISTGVWPRTSAAALVVLAPPSRRCRGAVGKHRGEAGGLRRLVYGTDVAESRGSAQQQLHLWQGNYQTGQRLFPTAGSRPASRYPLPICVRGTSSGATAVFAKARQKDFPKPQLGVQCSNTVHPSSMSDRLVTEPATAMRHAAVRTPMPLRKRSVAACARSVTWGKQPPVAV